MADIINPINGGMFDSTEVVETVSGFPKGNKAVDSAFFAKMISSFYKNGVLHDGGYAVTPSESGGLNVTVKNGVAWIKGYMAWLGEDTEVELEAGKDYAALIRLNIPAGEFKLIVTENTALIPIRTDSISDLIIAEISVPAGADEITASMITDTRGDQEKCGYVSNAVDGLGEALHSVDSDKLGGSDASDYLKKSGGILTGTLKAASGSGEAARVRNISYGTVVPSTLAEGEIFIQIEE